MLFRKYFQQLGSPYGDLFDASLARLYHARSWTHWTDHLDSIKSDLSLEDEQSENCFCFFLIQLRAGTSCGLREEDKTLNFQSYSKVCLRKMQLGRADGFDSAC